MSTFASTAGRLRTRIWQNSKEQLEQTGCARLLTVNIDLYGHNDVIPIAVVTRSTEKGRLEQAEQYHNLASIPQSGEGLS